MKEKIKIYVIAILIPLALGGLSALLTMGNMDLYSEIVKPSFAPPAILFPIAWSVLYVLMGISSGIICSSPALNIKKQSAMLSYGASLFFNFFWSIIFFNLRQFLFAFIWLLAMLFFIIRTIMKYHRIKPIAAYLQIPYALWVTFAGILNLQIWLLNG